MIFVEKIDFYSNEEKKLKTEEDQRKILKEMMDSFFLRNNIKELDEKAKQIKIKKEEDVEVLKKINEIKKCCKDVRKITKFFLNLKDLELKKEFFNLWCEKNRINRIHYNDWESSFIILLCVEFMKEITSVEENEETIKEIKSNLINIFSY